MDRVRVYCLSRDGFTPGQLWVLGPSLSAGICFSVWFNLLMNVLERPREKGSYWKHWPKDTSKNDILESKAESFGTGSLQQLAQRYLNCTIRRDWKGRHSSICRRGCWSGYNFGKGKSGSWMQNYCSLRAKRQSTKLTGTQNRWKKVVLHQKQWMSGSGCHRRQMGSARGQTNWWTKE